MNMTLFRLCALSVLIAVVSSAGLKEEFTWTILNYIWPGTDRRVEERVSRRQIDNVFEDPNISVEAFVTRDAPEGVEFIPENNIPMGANVWKNKLFITVPRRQPGIPATLNYVPLDSPNRHNVPLIPYPNLEINRYPGGRQNFLSVYRVAIDPCDRLWMADTGLIETPGNSSQVKASMIFVIDLNTDQVIHSYEIPTSFMRPASLLDSITIDVTENTCDDAYAYLPDLGGYSIIVYSLKQNRSWRVAHNYLFLENSQGDFNIHGHRFQWNDGVFNVELSSIKPTGFRDLYFHALAGSHLYRVSTRILRNETLATRSFHADDFQVVGDRGPLSQTTSADIDQCSGVMFMCLVSQNALGCWNTNKPLRTKSIVQRDDRRMIYPNDVKVYQDSIYVLTNTMPEFQFGRLNYDEVNFRIWTNTVAGAIEGTPCDDNYESNTVYGRRRLVGGRKGRIYPRY